MLFATTLLLVGFVAGVLVTGLIACRVYGLLHIDAVRAIDEQSDLFGGVTLRTHLSMPKSCPSTGQP